MNKVMKAKVIKTGEIVDVYHELQHEEVSNIYKESVFLNGRMWSEDELDFCVKANEAPEKIYLSPSELAGIDYDEEWYDCPFGDSIEYTRTDAFIEKACDAYCKVCGHYPHTVPTHICRHDCMYFSDFRNILRSKV